MRLELDGSSEAKEQGSAGLLGERAFHDRVRMRQAWEAFGVEPQLVAMLCAAFLHKEPVRQLFVLCGANFSSRVIWELKLVTQKR